MTEPAFSVESRNASSDNDRPPGDLVSGMKIPDLTGLPDAGLPNVRLACGVVNTFGTLGGWGLVLLGVLLGALRLVAGPESGSSGLHAWARVFLEAAIQVLEFLLAGWALAAFSGLMAAAIKERLEQAARVSDRLSAQAAQALGLLERITAAIETRGGPAVSIPTAELERARSVAEVLQAIKGADWAQAEKRLGEFEGAFPDEPELANLKVELAKARGGTIKESMARLEAARGVNDPDRVLEIYHELVPSLDDPQRAELDQDVARWFMGLIHRRLRTGKVQADVVQLASRFAESFAVTVEGASVRASLPTLRRSVGLCPRCAQPYTGVAEACPNCKKAAAQAPAAAASHDQITLTG